MKMLKIILPLLVLTYLSVQKIKAQNDTWCVVMKQGTHAEAYEHKSEFPANFISEQWKKKQYVTELTYDGKEWWVVTGAVKYSNQAYYKSKTFPGEWIEKKWNEGFDISNVEYGGGEWVVIMSVGTGYSGAYWAKRSSFDEIQAFIKSKWNEKKDIIDIAYGNGEWVAVLSDGADYDKQVYSWEKTFPHKWVQEKYNIGHNITTLTYGGGYWVVVMSKLSTQLAEQYQTESSFPSVFIEEQWKKNKRLAFFHYNYEINQQFTFDEYFNAGNKASDEEDHELAVYYYTEALKIQPANATAYNNRAWSKYLLGQCSGALADANQSITLGANSYSYHTRASVYMCLDRCRDAMTDYNKALSIADKKEAFYYADRGLAEYCLGDYQKALTDLNKALSLEPNNKDYKNDLADIKLKLGENEAPKITWDYPFKEYTTATEDNYKIKACIQSKSVITEVQVFINGKSFASKGFGVDDDCTQSVDQSVKLLPGKNELEIVVKTASKTTRSEKRTIEYKSTSKSGNYHALLIAVGNYQDMSFNDLEKPIVDAIALQSVLTQNYTFEPGDVTLLKNPTKEMIINKLAVLQDRLGPDDNLLVYYSGHGIVKNEVGYWLPSDATRESRMAWLSNAELRDYMNGMKAKHTLIIADACFSGSIFTGAYRDVEEFACEEMAKMKSRRAMTSGANTIVPDESVFFKYLSQKLKENTTSCLSAETLYSKIKPAVIYNSPNNHIPQFGVLPQVGDEGGNFIFRKRN
jgi:tetratricopeptide (TPR) repeat protein